MNKIEQIEIPLRFQHLKKGTLTKQSDDKFGGRHPNDIYEGYSVRGGYYSEKPTIGETFEISSRMNKYFHTSVVTEIVEETNERIIFTTMNSTYELIKL